MNDRLALIAVLTAVSLAFATACGGDDETDDGGAGRGGTTASTTTATGSGGGSGGSSGTGGQGGAPACAPPSIDTDGQGCITFDGGVSHCALEGDAICNFAIGCGVSTEDLGQCQINCSQGMVVGTCYEQADADCVYRAAICNASCTELATCMWPFF